MSYQEKRNVVNIISTLLITAGYFWYVFESRPDQGLNTDELLSFWAKTLLILIPVSIVAKIAIHILFGITNTIATKENIPSADERDKLIELKSTRNAQYLFGMGFILAMAALAMDKSVNVMFVVLVCSGVLSEIFDNLSQLYFYRRGI